MCGGRQELGPSASSSHFLLCPLSKPPALTLHGLLPSAFTSHRSLQIGQTLDHLQWTGIAIPVMGRGWFLVWSQLHSRASWVPSHSFRLELRHEKCLVEVCHSAAWHQVPRKAIFLVISLWVQVFWRQHKYLWTAAYSHLPAVNELLPVVVNALWNQSLIVKQLISERFWQLWTVYGGRGIRKHTAMLPFRPKGKNLQWDFKVV